MESPVNIYFLALKEPFTEILASNKFNDVATEIVNAISKGELDTTSLDSILKAHGMEINAIKGELLDIILAYINFVLDDDYITEKEADNVKFLKLLFKIKEGNFYKLKHGEVEKILGRQFEHMYQDNRINNEEALQRVELQQLFDLGYDQFLHLSDKAVKAALARGADPKNWMPLSGLVDRRVR